ncbi:MAG: peroxiredoxin [Rickettsiaceae bacterium]|nr:peroxiredoxin [Rickettsiaceae bacterium]
MVDQTVFIGKEAPDFTSKAIMPDGRIEESFNLKQYLGGKKGIVFFYPLNFTFVCPTEIIAFNNRIGEFTSRDTKIVAVSVDSHFSHLAWKNIPTNKGGIGNIQFPLVSDLNKAISTAYNVLNEDSISLRGTFLVDKDFMIRHFVVNDLPLGRNVDETLRMIDALDYHNTHGEVCPAGWQKEQEGMNPTQQGVTDYLISNAEKL